MTDSGRGSKDVRRRSIKQSTSSSAAAKRPKSDSSRNTAENSSSRQPVTSNSRPELQERTYSEPAKRLHSKTKPPRSSLNVSSAQSETFLLRPSIDQVNLQSAPPLTSHDFQEDVNASSHRRDELDTAETVSLAGDTTTELAQDSPIEKGYLSLYNNSKATDLTGQDVVLAVSQQTQRRSGVNAESSDEALIDKLSLSDSGTLPQQALQTLHVPNLSEKRSSSSFLNLEDSPRPSFGQIIDEDEASDFEAASRRFSTIEDIPSASEIALTFDNLTTRLLSPTSPHHDSKFSVAFLTFYRFFAAPSRLLDAIIRHFDSHNTNDITPWVHEPTLDRDLNILDRWITSYPGDFAKQSTRSKLARFLSRIIEEHGIVEEDQFGALNEPTNLAETLGNAARLAASASQIRLALDHVQEDDDTDWAYADEGSLRRSRTNTFLSMSSTDSLTESDEPTALEPLTKVTSTNPAYDAKVIFGGGSTLTLNAMGRSRSATKNDSTSSSQTLLDVAESANRQAALLSPNSHHTFGKLQWRAFLAQSDDLIARELTRIDWIMFSSIRSRDLIRHVTVPASERTRYRSLENVTRMTDHFNHVAYWVTNLVLFRDKPKHRAQALEKFMRIARKLRELNNYNALGAVIAGIQGTAVYRLGLTKELVNQNVQRDFMKVEILMATTKSHWAYRLAWENSSSARIPFIPLHRRDLVMADNSGKTFSSSAIKQNPSVQPEPVRDDRAPDVEKLQISDSEKPAEKGSKKGSLSRSKSLSRPKSKSKPSRPNVTTTNATTKPTTPMSPQSSQNKTPKSPIKPNSPQSLPPSQSSSAQINWQKFSIMGEVISTLQRAQLTPYVGFTENEEVKALILDYNIIKDDDELYARSVALEPGSNALIHTNSSSSGAVGASAGVASALQDPAVRKKVLERIGQLVG